MSIFDSARILRYPLQTYNVLWATMEQYLKQGLISDSKVLDIRQVEVRLTRILYQTSTSH